MDISKFNNILGTQIAQAKSFEKQGDIKSAIKVWIDVSELTLSFSKKPDLDFTYKHMLLSRTEQILQHIRDLKSPKKKKMVVEKPKTQVISDIKTIEPVETKESAQSSTNLIESALDKKKDDQSELIDENWMENINIKNQPKGVIEVSAPKEFKIVTPHDPNYVEKMKKLSGEIDFFKDSNKDKKNDKLNGIKKFCFACGAEIPQNAETCKECGVKLK